MEASRGINGRFVGLAAASGAAGGVVMAMWMMVYSAATPQRVLDAAQRVYGLIHLSL